MIYRRDFIKGLIGAALAIGVDPFWGISVANDIYTNHRLGLSCSKPPGWEFDSIADFAVLREQQILHSTVPNDMHPLKDSDKLPTFIMKDPNHRQGHFAPSINLWDESHPHDTPIDEIEAHRSMILDFFGGAYRDVELVIDPLPAIVDGATGTESTWRYLHEIEVGESWQIGVRTLLIFRDSRVHTYHLVDDALRPRIPNIIFDKFIHSIRYRATIE